MKYIATVQYKLSSIVSIYFYIWILNIKYQLLLTCWRLSSLVWNERCWHFASSLWGLGTFSLTFLCRPSFPSRRSSTSPDLLQSLPRSPSWALGLANLNQCERGWHDLTLCHNTDINSQQHSTRFWHSWVLLQSGIFKF